MPRGRFEKGAEVPVENRRLFAGKIWKYRGGASRVLLQGLELEGGRRKFPSDEISCRTWESSVRDGVWVREI